MREGDNIKKWILAYHRALRRSDPNIHKIYENMMQRIHWYSHNNKEEIDEDEFK